MYFTIGADVEIFGKDGNNNFVALCGKIGGTKESPLQLKDSPEGFMVQEDNVSLEYNIPVSSTRHDFVSNISYMRTKTKEILTGLGLNQATECAVSFPDEELTHPNAKVFGCEPDYDAWKKIENQKPHAEDKNLRTAGGHVHVGTNDVDMIDGIRAMDLYLGVPSVILDNSPSASKRRQLYGKAGAMRPKPYGFEYRVLSNFWMFDDNLIRWVYNATKAALSFAFNHGKITNIEAEEIQTCINTGNVELAHQLVKKYSLLMPKEEQSEEGLLKYTTIYKTIDGIKTNPFTYQQLNNIQIIHDGMLVVQEQLEQNEEDNG